MMQNPHSWFTPPTARSGVDAGEYLPYTSSSVWRYPADGWFQHRDERLYDTETDPGQTNNLVDDDSESVAGLRSLLNDRLAAYDAPDSQWTRLGL
ncbi:hypothetical protein ACFQH8_05450 [Halomicroarcula sp. GCM10025710]